MVEEFLTWVNLIWNFVEPLIFLFVILLFFKDPIRRWNFFGYRPTAIMGLFDPRLGKLVFSKVNGYWSFNQGGIYNDNIYVTSAEILQRELGFPSNRFKLIYTKPMGTIRISNKTLLTRARISAFTISKQLRGKGYMTCFIRTNLKDAEEIIHKGAGIQEVRIVDFDEAKKLVEAFSEEHAEHNPLKRKMILKVINEIEEYANKIKDWEDKNIYLHEDSSTKATVTEQDKKESQS